MKKTTLSEWMSSNDVRTLNISKLHSLKGGCGNDNNGMPYATPTTDDETGDGDGCTGGPNDFIPPPGT